MRELAIIIRCHGIIPINFDYGWTEEKIFSDTIFNHTGYIKTITMITLAKMGGVCYGSPDVKKYIKKIDDLYNELYEKENVKNTEELVNYLYGPNPKIEQIRKINEELFGISFTPEITKLEDYSINKYYSGDTQMKNLGIYYLSSNGLTGQEIEIIKNEFEQMSNYLNSSPVNYITKIYIFDKLGKILGRDTRLYFIDLTCFAFKNMNKQAEKERPLNEPAIDWLNSVITHRNLKGGKKRSIRKKRKTRKLRKIKKKQKSNKNI